MNCLLIDPAAIDNNTTCVTGAHLTHLTNVLKVVSGDRIKCGILNGPLCTGVIASIDHERAIISLEPSGPPPAPFNGVLVCALPRPKALRRVILAATTLGVKEIHLLKTWRVDKSYWLTPLLAPQRLRELLVEGLEQCVDTMLPTVHLQTRFKPFVEDQLPQILHNARGVALHPGAASPHLEASSTKTVLLIGPEGGFIPYEVGMLLAAGCLTAQLGPRVLRVEDAVAVGLGVLSTAG